jgi:preprotein translocase SecE subunit
MSAEVDDEVVDDQLVDESGWWSQGWGEIKQVIWPKREVLIPLLVGVALVVICLGALTTGLDYVFGHIVVRIYGSSAQKASTVIGALTILDLLIGFGAVAGILAHRGTDGGLSSLGGINQAQWATGSSAAGRRVDLGTYALVGGFVVLSAVLSYFLGS